MTRTNARSAIGALVCAVVVAVLAARVHGTLGPLRIDQRLARPVFAHVWGLSIVPLSLSRTYVHMSTTMSFVAAVLVLGLVALAWRDLSAAALALSGPLAAELLDELVAKPLIGRRIVATGAWSFPSGHTAAATALATAVAIIGWRLWGSRWGAVFSAVGAAAAVGMGLAVVRTHAHVPTDAIGGAAFGAGVVLTFRAAIPDQLQWPRQRSSPRGRELRQSSS